jgi:hypothetical protein
MWPFALPKSTQIRVEALEERAIAVEHLLKSFNVVYRDVFDGSTSAILALTSAMRSLTSFRCAS